MKNQQCNKKLSKTGCNYIITFSVYYNNVLLNKPNLKKGSIFLVTQCKTYWELLIIGTGSIDGNKPFVLKLFSEILTNAGGNVLNKFTTVFRRTVLFSFNITTFIGLTCYQTDIWHKAIVSTCFL